MRVWPLPERGIAPHTWTHSNIATMKSQMLRLGIQFDWDKVRFPRNATQRAQ